MCIASVCNGLPLFGEFPCETARDVLGWRPVEEREEFLDRCVRIYGER